MGYGVRVYTCARSRVCVRVRNCMRVHARARVTGSRLLAHTTGRERLAGIRRGRGRGRAWAPHALPADLCGPQSRGGPDPAEVPALGLTQLFRVRGGSWKKRGRPRRHPPSAMATALPRHTADPR